MKNWRIYIIISVITIALFGLIWVQSSFIKNGMYIQEKLFNQFVEEAMLRVAVNIEEREAYNYFNKNTDINPSYQANISSASSNESYSLSYENNIFTAIIVKGDSTFEVSSTDILELDEKIEKLGLHVSFAEQEEFSQLNQSIFNSKFQVNYSQLKQEELATDSTDLYKLLLYELKRSGINTSFHFALLESFTLKKFSSNCEQLINPDFFKRAYKTSVLINGFTGNEAYLLLDFPKKRTFLIQSNSKLLISSFIFILLIVASFVASWYIIFKQKKLSELKTDFINNMTHELKTPVATISLASEMLGKEKVQNDIKKLQNYTNIIKEENVRLGSHIEKVLQTAQLDKEAIKLNKTPVDFHELLGELEKKFALQIQNAKAKVNWNLNAKETKVYVDKTHFLNALSNLLDNALKYRKPESLVIDICTANKQNLLLFSIKDNGIGMSKANVKRIFEKFYRVPTGNLHNVKGFGLGLSYVKTMIDEHNGKIKIDSELDKYTKFKIQLENYTNR